MEDNSVTSLKDYGVALVKDDGLTSLDDGVISMEDNSVTSLKDDGVTLLVTVQKTKPFCIFKGQNQTC